MSVEALLISELVRDGNPKKAFQAGISVDDFVLHDDEFNWLLDRAEHHKSISPRIFKKKFPEFEYMATGERVADLIDELKKERAYVAISSGIEEILTDLDQDNAVDKAFVLREILGEALRVHAPNNDVLLKSDWKGYVEHLKQLQILREAGKLPGITTGIPHFDHHFGGLQNETSYVFLGRPGDAKSLTLAKLATEAEWEGYRVGFFSPEMTENQHRARFNTMRSSRKEVQEAVGLKGAFRNRALKDGHGFNIKKFIAFQKWYEDNVSGEIFLFTQKYRRTKMSVSYIESRIEDYGLDVIFIDPLYKLKPPRHRGNKWEELGEITDSLIDLAHAFNIPIVMSNQANRAYMGGKGDAPGKDSSFGSDTPIQEADCVVGVKHFADEHIMKVKCSKNRHGESFDFKCKILPNIGVLEDVTGIKGDYFNGYDPEKVAELHEVIKEEERGSLA